MIFTAKDVKDVIDRYTKRYKEFGYDPKSFGWDKGKQEVRFDILTSQYNFENKHILDIGCGFGDLNKMLMKKASHYMYTGFDLVDVLLREARKKYQNRNVNFIKGNILNLRSQHKYDYAISSGIFNYRLSGGNNYEFIEAVMEKALRMTNDGIAFDFLSDKVDYRLGHTFHRSPEKILSIAYRFSRNIVLRNDYMPFEFTIFIFKDDRFSDEDTVFMRYKKRG